jgi:hypothetical protein
MVVETKMIAVRKAGCSGPPAHHHFLPFSKKSERFSSLWQRMADFTRACR